MRSFSEIEQKYIKKIVETNNNACWSDLVLKNLIYSIFNREIILSLFPGFEIKDGESNIKEQEGGYNKAIKDGYIPIAIFLDLLKYLHKNALISIIPYFDSSDFFFGTIGEDEEEEWQQPEKQINNQGQETNLAKKYFEISDHSYLKFLKKNYSYIIHPSQELVDLVKNKFQSKDEHRYKKQIWATWISIALAFVIGLAGLLKSSRIVELEPYQMNEIINRFKQHKNETVKTNILLDSIKGKSIKLQYNNCGSEIVNNFSLFKNDKL